MFFRESVKVNEGNGVNKMKYRDASEPKCRRGEGRDAKSVMSVPSDARWRTGDLVYIREGLVGCCSERTRVSSQLTAQ